MQCFIGIVPPAHIYQTIVDIQKQFGDNRLEPHITLRAPVNIEAVSAWLAAIEIACRSFSAIEISLPATGNFGKQVLFIDVRSSQLSALHHTITKALKPFEPEHKEEPETRPFKAHLTLGRAWCGFTPNDFTEMNSLADQYLAREPVFFEAAFVRVYHKPNKNGRYQTLKDVKLAG